MRVLTNAWAWPVKARDRLEWILCTEEVVDALRHTLLDVWTGKSPRRKPRCQTPCRTRARRVADPSARAKASRAAPVAPTTSTLVVGTRARRPAASDPRTPTHPPGRGADRLASTALVPHVHDVPSPVRGPDQHARWSAKFSLAPPLATHPRVPV